MNPYIQLNINRLRKLRYEQKAHRAKKFVIMFGSLSGICISLSVLAGTLTVLFKVEVGLKYLGSGAFIFLILGALAKQMQKRYIQIAELVEYQSPTTNQN